MPAANPAAAASQPTLMAAWGLAALSFADGTTDDVGTPGKLAEGSG